MRVGVRVGVRVEVRVGVRVGVRVRVRVGVVPLGSEARALACEVGGGDRLG